MTCQNKYTVFLLSAEVNDVQNMKEERRAAIFSYVPTVGIPGVGDQGLLGLNNI